MIKKKLWIPLIIILALTLTACNTVKEPVVENPVVDQAPNVENTDENLVQEGNETLINPVAAFDLYMEKYPTTKLRKIQLDNDRGLYSYKLNGYENGMEYEFKLNAINGDIINEESKNENDLNKDGEITKENIENIEEYVNKVLQEAGENSTLDEWTLKAKSGRPLLEVEVDLANGNDIEYTYDIKTGELVEKDD